MLALHSVPVCLGRVVAPVLFGLCLVGPGVPASPARGDSAVQAATVATSYGQLPISFEINRGQTDPSVDFLAHAAGSTLFLSSGVATLSLSEPASVVRVQADGAKPHAEAVGEQPLPGVANYVFGTDPEEWHTDIPTYARVRYRDIYPGVDLIYYSTQGHLEYDFQVSPGADPTTIRLHFDGANRVDLDQAGALVLQLTDGQLRQPRPLIFQDGPNGRESVLGGYAIDDDGTVSFAVAAYDPGRPLTIDPVLAYSTLLGGGGSDRAKAVAVDGVGQAYVTGATGSLDFPTTTGVVQSHLPDSGAAFVSKLNASGSELVYTTYLGGSSGSSGGTRIAVDAGDNAYVGGLTGSVDFPPTPGAFQRSPGQSFIGKLNPSGSALVYSTYLSGAAVFEITVDSTGSAYLSGITGSAAFPTTPDAFQRSLPGVAHAFVTKLNSGGTGLVYSTYLGGSASENGLMQAGIAVDPAGNAYVTGITESRDFPVTPGAFQPTFMPGTFGADAFLSKLNPAGSGLVYSSYLSGSDGSDGEKVALDASNNAYVVGAAFSSDFPTTPGAFQTTLGGPSDAFVSKVSPGPPACVDVTLPDFVSGTTDSVVVTGTALDPTRIATFTLHATDLTGSASDCTIGGGTPPPPRI